MVLFWSEKSVSAVEPSKWLSISFLLLYFRNHLPAQDVNFGKEKGWELVRAKYVLPAEQLRAAIFVINPGPFFLLKILELKPSLFLVF